MVADINENAEKKTRVLVFIGHYLPGFKSGGILRSVENAVNNLNSEFEYFIITRNCDLGEKNSYQNIVANQWQKIGNSKVYYFSDDTLSFNSISKIVNETPHDLVHLNSFFEYFTVMVLLGRKLGKIYKSPIILSPRGEFAWASLKIKLLKKTIYILASRFFFLYEGITWHGSCKHEKEDIIKIMNVEKRNISIAKDLPVKVHNLDLHNMNDEQYDMGPLRIVFLSRISPEKNLDYAINILSKVKVELMFDIYGTIENKRYWEKCTKLISVLPDNITVSYKGVAKPDSVVKTFSKYDLFFFPSGGENYGHVIAESLSAGTPVLISKNTPWLELDDLNLGWDIELMNTRKFIDIIEQLALMSRKERKIIRKHICSIINDILFDQNIIDENRQLYLQALN